MPDTILVDIEGFGQIKVSAEYAWKPLICTLCKSMGHTDKFCKAFKEWKPKESVPKASDNSVPLSSVGSDSTAPPECAPTPTVPSDGDSEGTRVPSSSVSESASFHKPNDATAEGDVALKSGPGNATKPQVPDDGSTEGTIVPLSTSKTATAINSVKSTNIGAQKSNSKFSYSLPSKPVFSPNTHDSPILVDNSFFVLGKENNDPEKNKFNPQKRTKKQTQKAKEYKSQSVKGFGVESTTIS